jgi:hypothetical protein
MFRLTKSVAREKHIPAFNAFMVNKKVVSVYRIYNDAHQNPKTCVIINTDGLLTIPTVQKCLFIYDYTPCLYKNTNSVYMWIMPLCPLSLILLVIYKAIMEEYNKKFDMRSMCCYQHYISCVIMQDNKYRDCIIKEMLVNMTRYTHFIHVFTTNERVYHYIASLLNPLYNKTQYPEYDSVKYVPVTKDTSTNEKVTRGIIAQRNNNGTIHECTSNALTTIRLCEFNVDFFAEMCKFSRENWHKTHVAQKNQILLIDQLFYMNRDTWKSRGTRDLFMNGRIFKIGLTLIDEPRYFSTFTWGPDIRTQVDFVLYAGQYHYHHRNTRQKLESLFYIPDHLFSMIDSKKKYIAVHNSGQQNMYVSTIDTHDYHMPFYLTVFYNTKHKQKVYKSYADLVVKCTL